MSTEKPSNCTRWWWVWLLNNELCLRFPHPPSDAIWCIGRILCIRTRVERTTSYPTNIILLSYIFCQIIRTPFIKWCQSPKIGDTTTSPVQEYCSVMSRLAIFQRARLNSSRWQWYRVALTHPIIWDIKTVAISHFRGCIIYHAPNFPMSRFNPWFYPSWALYWYVSALQQWILSHQR